MLVVSFHPNIQTKESYNKINPLGCGGYIKIGDGGNVMGKGTISKPANPSTETSLTECLWFIEKSNPAHTIVLNNPSGKSAFPTIV